MLVDGVRAEVLAVGGRVLNQELLELFADRLVFVLVGGLEGRLGVADL